MKKKIAIVVFSFYPHDLRIRRAAEAALRAYYCVDIYCLRKPGQKRFERSLGLRIYRSSIPRTRSSKLNYLIEYLLFSFVVLAKLSIKNLFIRYDVIHVNNMPDILVLCGLVPKIGGAKIILDMHDPMPEVFITKYNLPTDSIYVRFLVFLEKLSIGLSDTVITTNIAFRDLFIGRGCPPGKIKIVMNAPDEEVFIPHVKKSGPLQARSALFSVVFNGTIVKRHGLDIAIDAILSLKSRIPQIAFDIYGEGDYAEHINNRILSLGPSSNIHYHGFAHVNVLLDIIRNSDLGVVPNIRSVFTEINFPVRIFEYLIFKKPIIVPNTRGIRDYFNQDSIILFEPGNAIDLANKIYFVYSNPEKTKQIVAKGFEIYQKHNWNIQKEVLLNIYDNLSNIA